MFDREKSNKLLDKALALADKLNREGMPYADYSNLYDVITDLYDSFSEVDSEIKTLQSQLTEAQRWEKAAVEDLTYFAGAITTGEPCSRCLYNPNDMGCELDGSQLLPFDDVGECHFKWRGPETDG